MSKVTGTCSENGMVKEMLHIKTQSNFFGCPKETTFQLFTCNEILYMIVQSGTRLCVKGKNPMYMINAHFYTKH